MCEEGSVAGTVLLLERAHGRLSLVGAALVGRTVGVRDLARHQVELGLAGAGLEGLLRPVGAEGGGLGVHGGEVGREVGRKGGLPRRQRRRRREDHCLDDAAAAAGGIVGFQVLQVNAWHLLNL